MGVIGRFVAGADRSRPADALADAQKLGYAEADPYPRGQGRPADARRAHGSTTSTVVPTTVTTVRPTAGNVFLAAEADTAGPPVATLDEDIDLVDEHAVHRGPGGPPEGYTGLEPTLT